MDLCISYITTASFKSIEFPEMSKQAKRRKATSSWWPCKRGICLLSRQETDICMDLDTLYR